MNVDPTTAVQAVATAGEAAAQRAELMTLTVLQLALIIVAARAGGLIARRYLRLPSALGELLAGVLIGPFGLGQYIRLPGLGVLFPIEDPLFPVSPELYALATIASIILLFSSGLETDLTVFLRYSVVGSLVGLGGVVVSFLLGAFCAKWFHLSPTLAHPAALFLGTISTATSVGITARVLSDRRKMSSPEGVAILAGAVIDDVLGIVVLAIVVGLTRAASAGETLHWEAVGSIAAKAVGFWLICTAIGILSARRFAWFIKLFRTPDAMAGVALGLALLLAGLSETAGLAMIIGAYIMGLSLSRTDVVTLLQRQLESFYDVFVPVFFCVMGMLVNLGAMKHVVVIGLVYTALAMVAKLAGCGLPAWLMQFNWRGAVRIGVGMIPRGEVALIVAGIGLSVHAISQDVFGVAIMMTMLTTLIGPPIMESALAGPSGLKDSAAERKLGDQRDIVLEFPSEDLAAFMRLRLVQAFRKEEFFVLRPPGESDTYQIRKDDMVMTLAQSGASLIMTVSAKHESVVRLIALEELLVLQDLAQSFERLQGLESLKSNLASGVFGG
jgi:Kef-type K+ transport system membrane component KefB